MRVRDGDLIRWFRDLLIGNTGAGQNVYAWRKTPSDLTASPLINVTLDRRTSDRVDSHGRGADKTDRRLAVILLVRGSDEEGAESGDQWAIDRLDDLESEVLDLLDYDDMPPSGPAGVMRSNLTEVVTQREDTNRQYAARYLIFSILTHDPIRSR